MLKGIEEMYLYETEEKKNIVVVCYAPDALSAITQANRYFKCSKDMLTSRKGYVDEHGLWWDKAEDRIPCFAVWRA